MTTTDSIRLENAVFFDVSVEELQLIFEKQSWHQLSWYGGPVDLFGKLFTSSKCGISSSTADLRRKTFGSNEIEVANGKDFWFFISDALKDHILVLLLVTGFLSLGIGIYQDVYGGTRHHWIEGTAICTAVILIVLITAVNDYRRNKQFQSLNKKKNDRIIKGIRDGRPCVIGIDDIVVGDIVILEPGDFIPADGILISDLEVKCDESQVTGESDHVEKTTEGGRVFLISGTNVVDGTGEMLVTGVGQCSTRGIVIQSMQETKCTTPLQQRLNTVAEIIAKIGIGAGVLLFTINFIHLMITFYKQRFSSTELFFRILHDCIQSLSLLAVAVPEGLPLAIALVLAYSTSKMLKDNNLVRVMSACETMGNATIICTDKTGTLTTNKMRVVSGIICNQQSDIACTNWLLLSEDSKRLVAHALAINSTAYETICNSSLEISFVGSKTEAALLNLVKNFGYDYYEIRQTSNIKKVIPFSSTTKVMHTLVESDDGTAIAYSKGAPEVILENSKYYVDVEQKVKKLTKDVILQYQESLDKMSKNSLRTIAFGYKIFKGKHANSEVGQDLILIGIIGIEDPLRDEVETSIVQCQDAGVRVIMITGDNMETAKSIAHRTGILSNDGTAMEGSEFRILSDEEFNLTIPKLQVIARSSPLDKQILVRKLKAMNEIVAVTGDGSNDGPALKSADVGFSMGLSGTDIAVEASSIVLMDDNFASIVSAIKWGRSINESIRKFIQFQLCVNLATVILMLVTSLISQPIFSALQLLWINLIMDTLAALALATEPPSRDLLKEKPLPRNVSLISKTMWHMIFSQAFMQSLVTLLIHYLWHSSIAFNTFVLMQIFNLVSCRHLATHQLNAFRSIYKNYLFSAIILAIFAGQVLIMFLGREIFNIAGGLSFMQWIWSILIGSSSLLLGTLVKVISHKWELRKSIQLEASSSESERIGLLWNAAIKDVRTQLRLYNILHKGY